MAVRYGVLSDGVVARQVARVQTRIVGRLQHASLFIAVAEYPRTVSALHQFAHVKRFVYPWKTQNSAVEIGPGCARETAQKRPLEKRRLNRHYTELT